MASRHVDWEHGPPPGPQSRPSGDFIIDPAPPTEPESPLEPSLLARAKAGDTAALQTLCLHLEPRLRQAASKKLGQLLDKTRLSDVLQSTFIDIVRSAEGMPDQTPAEVEHWSLRVLDNNIRDLARYYTAERRDRAKERPLDALADGSMPANSPSPASELVQSEDVTRLALALKALPADYQRILQLFLRPDFSHESAAQSLNRSVGASRVLLARARAALLSAMDAENS